MSVQRPPNPLDTVCQHLSISHLMANGNQSDIHPSHVDTELDGLYEFAKIVQPIIHQNPGRLRAAELLLDAVGLHLEFTGFPNLDRSRKPHIFVANSPGCALIDAAIGTRLVARLGLPPSRSRLFFSW